MSEANPRAAIRALLAAPIEVCDGVRVLPLTLAHYAMLERIASPLVVPRDASTVGTLELIASFFIVTHTVAELSGIDLEKAAMAWAETLSPTVLPRLREACEEQVRAIIEVAPDSKKKGVEQAGVGG